MLVTWWSFFIYRSIEDRTLQQKTILKHELGDIFHRMIDDKTIPVVKGEIERDHRFEIVVNEPGDGSIYSEISGSSQALYLKVSDHIIEGIEEDQRRKKLMVFGESGLLAFAVLVSIIFLFKFIYLEKRSTKELEEFWGRISHEIRTPITGLRSFLESLRDGAISDEKLPGFIKLALKQIEKQEQLAENVLSGSSFKSNINLNLEEFDLNEFLRVYFNDHAFVMADGILKFDKMGTDVLFVSGDKYALKIIMDNIIDNAGKCVSEKLELSVKTLNVENRGVIIIKDNGPGFTSDCSEKIFSAYKYMKDELPKTPHGTGMGLYISRKLARQMYGDISASSDGEGRGAIFEIFLPLVK